MAKPKSVRSLKQFVNNKKRAKCPMCQLPPDVLKQVRLAREASYPRRPDVLAWLNDELHFAITEDDWYAHARGRHEAL